jgi:hypothetical protein
VGSRLLGWNQDERWQPEPTLTDKTHTGIFCKSSGGKIEIIDSLKGC